MLNRGILLEKAMVVCGVEGARLTRGRITLLWIRTEEIRIRITLSLASGAMLTAAHA